MAARPAPKTWSDIPALPATALGRLAARVRVSARERIRTRFGNRIVVRTVAGARLAMPWSHRLPDYTRVFPGYGRNLVALAEALHDGRQPLTVIDVGANIGDSTLQILARVDARVLCVDGDPYWLPFLRRNTAGETRVSIEPALVTSEDAGSGTLTAIRAQGTTRFVPGVAAAPSDPPAQVSVSELRRRHPDFADVRLIKSDIDGYDCRVVPLLAQAWADAGPVLFFEYDPELTRRSGDPHPERLWDELGRLGYSTAAVWTNFGSPVGSGDLDDLRAAAAVLDLPAAQRPYDFWDVALARTSDTKAIDALYALVPRPLSEEQA